MRTTREKNARKFVDNMERKTCFSGAWCTWYENEALQEKLDLTRRQLTYALQNAEDLGLIKRFENGAAFRLWHEMEGVPGYGLDPKGPKNMPKDWTPRRVIVFPHRLGERVRPEGLYGPLGLDAIHKDSRVTILSPESDAAEGARVTKVSLAGSQKCDSPGHKSVTRAPIRSLNPNLEGKETTLNVVPAPPSSEKEPELDKGRRASAFKLIQGLRMKHGWTPTLTPDGRSFEIVEYGGFEKRKPLDERVMAIVQDYTAEIIAELGGGRAAPSPASGVADGPRKPPAPKIPPVPREVQAKIRGLAGRLCGGDADAGPELAAEMCEAFAEKDRATSMKFFKGLLGEVAAGEKPPDLLTAALDAAMDPTEDERGKAFTGCVKRLLGESHRRREGSRPASPHHA